MSNALDVKVRTDSLNDKITYAAEVRQLYHKRRPLSKIFLFRPNLYSGNSSQRHVVIRLSSRRLLTLVQTSTHSMELVIIALIAVEVVIVRPCAPFKGNELTHRFAGSNPRRTRALGDIHGHPGFASDSWRPSHRTGLTRIPLFIANL
jgi:hypothetical protein